MSDRTLALVNLYAALMFMGVVLLHWSGIAPI